MQSATWWFQFSLAWWAPKHVLTPDLHPPHKCPKHSHLSSNGTSKENRLLAQTKARENLSNKLSERVRRLPENRLMVKKLPVTVAQHSAQKPSVTVLKLESHIYNQGKVYRKNDQFWTLACINRQKTQDLIWEKIKDPMKDYTTAVQQAKLARLDHNRLQFTKAMNQAQEARIRVLPGLLQIQALSTDDSFAPAYKIFQNMEEGLKKQAQDVRKQLLVSIVVDDQALTAITKKRIKSATYIALKDLNIHSLTSLTKCQNDNHPSHILSISYDARCQPASQRYTCRPMIKIHIQDCHYQKTIQTTINTDTAVHWQRQQAVNTAIERLQPAILKKTLHVALYDNLPLVAD